MDLLPSDNEGSSADEEEEEERDDAVPTSEPVMLHRPDRRYLIAAPPVRLTTLALSMKHSDTVPPENKMIMTNPTKAVLYQPIQGPQVMDPSIPLVMSKPELDVAFDETLFQQQRTAFQQTGKALDPSGNEVYRTTLGYTDRRLELMTQQEEKQRKRPRSSETTSSSRRNDPDEDLVQGSDDEIEYGIWAPPGQEERWAMDNNLTDVQKGGVESLAPEQLAERNYIKERDRQRGVDEKDEEESAFERLLERKMAHLLPPKNSKEAVEPSTTFHEAQEYDYKGRSWIAPPPGTSSVPDVNVDRHWCHVPKKCVHRFTGHNKGVHRIRLFPITGHLLLSAGLDGKCKIWSVERKTVIRTYIGHSAAVRDVQFNSNGTRFVSASYDRYLRLWNTESGEVLQTFTNRKVPYVVQFYPKDDNFFVVGCSDNKIVTYNATTAEISQEYNHHLAPVNAIVFVEDNGIKMVTSSDDKKILVWEWDIGVPIKYISDPTMHSMPCLAMHPTQQFFCGQSLDNTIAVFQAGNRFQLQKKRKFSGHIVSGYACELAFSPDGQFLVSGDGTGSLFIWDWKRHRILQKFRAHTSGPAISCVWHPVDSSTLFTCGWDGIIKMWT